MYQLASKFLVLPSLILWNKVSVRLRAVTFPRVGALAHQSCVYIK